MTVVVTQPSGRTTVQGSANRSVVNVDVIDAEVTVTEPAPASVSHRGGVVQGPPGPTGAQGPAGPAGPQGEPGPEGDPARERRRFYGSGAPTTVIGAAPGDEYVDVDTGDLYHLT